MAQLGTFDREKFEEQFVVMDLDKNGYLDHHEMKAALKALGYNLTPEEFKILFQHIDESGDGKISKDEFFSAMEATFKPERHQEAVLRRVFTIYDKDKSGTIEIGELKDIFEEMGKKMTEDRLQKIMNFIDTDKSGSLDFDEFYRAFAYDDETNSI